MSSKQYAYIALALYIVMLVVIFLTAKVNIRPKNLHESDIIYIEMVNEEPPRPKSPPQPKVKEAPRHENFATNDNSQQAAGKEEVTRTVNPKALFKMSKDGADKAANAGNPYAHKDSVTTAAGSGGGLNPIGNDALDEGLQGRGLVGSLPQPVYPAGNRGGRVVIRVAVNQRGAVTEAAYEPKGSTTSDKALVDAAIAAARKARFTESRAFVQGGRITYIFKMN